MKYLKILGFCYLLFCCTVSIAQAESNPSHTITSSVFDKDRRIKVFLPERYANDTISKFAVLYVLDAQSDRYWNMAKGNIGYMVDNYAVMPMIAVGVVSDNRGPEFSPENSKLHEHLRNEVFPLIEATYRVDDFRAVVGHSWGGAFIGNTIFSDQRDLFNAYIGISPSFGDTDNVIEKNAKTLLEAKTEFNKFLYFSYGTVGRREAEFGQFVKNIDELITSNPNKSLAWKEDWIQGVDHWQIVGPSFCNGLLWMSRNYFADQYNIELFAKNEDKNLKESIEEFISEKEALFKYSHNASSGYYNFVGNDFRDLDDYDTALQLYELALDSNPQNIRVHTNICDLYDKMGNVSQAKVKFENTLKLLEEQRRELSNNYYKNVKEWILEKLASYN